MNIPRWILNILHKYPDYASRWGAVKKRCVVNWTWKCPFCTAKDFTSYQDLDVHMRLGSHYDMYKIMNNLFLDILDEDEFE